MKIRPNPNAGETVELGFLGTVLQVEIPHSLDAQQVAETSSFNEKYNPKAHVCTLFSPSEGDEGSHITVDTGNDSTLCASTHSTF